MTSPEQPQVLDLALLDPAENREEFSKRLDKLFFRKDHTKEYVVALMLGDETKKQECVEKVLKQKAQKEKYLKDWDNASRKEEKQAVVGQVKGNYNPTPDEIDAVRPKA